MKNRTMPWAKNIYKCHITWSPEYIDGFIPKRYYFIIANSYGEAESMVTHFDRVEKIDKIEYIGEILNS